MKVICMGFIVVCQCLFEAASFKYILSTCLLAFSYSYDHPNDKKVCTPFAIDKCTLDENKVRE